MGPPGAGKGTQAKRLVEKFGMTHLSSGDIFRAEKASGSELGEKLAQYMTAGKLVPDEIVVEMMAKAMTSGDADAGLLLDGFPRTVAQAEALDATLAKAEKPLDAVILITADENEIVERITGRRSCPACGKAFHVKFIPSEKGELCDMCGEKIVQREDDTESVVRERLQAYMAQTEPVMEYYKTQEGLDVIEINGSQAPDAVTSSLFEAIEAVGAK